MASQRGTFLKRQRETDLKDKAKAKAQRRAEKRDQPTNGTKGPQIDWDSAVTEHDSGFGVTPPTPPPSTTTQTPTTTPVPGPKPPGSGNGTP